MAVTSTTEDNISCTPRWSNETIEKNTGVISPSTSWDDDGLQVGVKITTLNRRQDEHH
jgi:hypothetical protein